VIADAAVDQDDVVRRAQHIRLEAHDQKAVGIESSRLHPMAVLLKQIRIEPENDSQRRHESGLLLDDPVHRHVAGTYYRCHGLSNVCSWWR
jgi:hypothetical protein